MRCLMVWIPNWEINALVVDIPPGAHGAIEERGYVKTVTPSAWKCDRECACRWHVIYVRISLFFKVIRVGN